MNKLGFSVVLFGFCSQLLGLYGLYFTFKPCFDALCAQFKWMVLEDYIQTHSNNEAANLETQMDYWIYLISPGKYADLTFLCWMFFWIQVGVKTQISN